MRDMMIPLARLASSLSLAATLAACGGSDSSSSGPPPAISIASGAPSANVTIGQAPATVALTLARTGGASAPVDLTVSGAPAGVTATLTPATVAASATSADLTISAASAAVPGSATLVVTARSGTLSASTSVALTVQAAPDFVLAIDSASIGVPLSGSSATSLRLTRLGGFTGAVPLVLEGGSPAQVTATLDPAIPAGATTATLALASTGRATPGTYPLTVRATVPGVGSKTTSTTLRLTESGGVRLTVTPNVTQLYPMRSVRLAVAVTRTAPFTGPVTLAITSDPEVTYALSRAVVPAGESTATITATAGAIQSSSTPGSALTANGLGVREAVATVFVARTPLPATFAILQDPADTLRIAAGGSGSAKFDVIRGAGFTAPLRFTAFTPPAGVTSAFTLAANVTDSTRLQVTVAPTVPPGVYRLDWLADAGGGNTLGSSTRLKVLPAASAATELGRRRPQRPINPSGVPAGSTQ